MNQRYAFQASAVRHFVPLAEKEDPNSTLAENLRAAMETLDWLATKQELVNKLRDHNEQRPDLEFYTTGGGK